MEPLLVQLAETVAKARTLEELARPLLSVLQQVTGLESTYLTVIDLDRRLQHVMFADNSSELQIPEGLTVEWGDTLCKRALEEKTFFVDDVDQRWGDSEAAKALGLKTYLSTAVRTEGGSLYGTLCGASSSQVPMKAQAEPILRMFSQLIGQHVEREHLLQQLQRANTELSGIALTDVLTGLPNRRALQGELGRMMARCRREGGYVHVAFIDLDGFKAINDRYGHEIGDRFLASMARHLLKGQRAGDLLARLGGDEFVIVTPASELAETADLLRDNLARRTRALFDFGDVVIDYPGASVGLVTVGPDEEAVEDVLARADAAMYQVKRERRRQREARA